MSHFILKYRHSFIGLILLTLIAVACSTEKNTFVNRTYHSTTAKYNGYWNAKELLRVGLRDYRRNYKEDFYNILPLDLLPNEENVVDMYPVLDTAISKCKTVISKHSMPTASKPANKKAEHAKWIDQNWLLIGKANFYRRDYQTALDNFEFVRKFYTNRSSMYEGMLWKAKCQIELGDLAEAKRSLQILDNNYSNYLSEKKDGGSSKSKSKSKKSKKDDNQLPPFPKYLHSEIAKTKAHLALIENEQEKAINYLQEAVKKSQQKEEKARLNFIIGQLLQLKADESARAYYSKTIKLNAPFEMSFHAKINRATVGGATPDEIIHDLKKMAKEQKYLEYKDQIYFAMAGAELNRDDIAQGKKYLTQSAFYSLNNPRQKGVSYEKLGDLSFNERNYVFAQRYYDSSAQVIPDDYMNAESIRSKAANLSQLVENIDVVTYEDSVQRIAQLSEKDRDKFLKNLVKQLQEEERLRKEKEAQRAEEIRKLQLQLATQEQGDGNKWYWNNPKNVEEGSREFRNIWGQRDNEDDWRRSNKSPSFDFTDILEGDSIVDTIPKRKTTAIEELTPEILLADIPLTDSAMSLSNERLLAALYTSGIIYKNQLNETEYGAKQFQRVIDINIENKHNVLSAFQLYKINEKNPSTSSIYKAYILSNYPNSDYANYLRDPDYFIKKKELDALALQDYLKSVEQYESGLYYPVILKADNVINVEPDNKYRGQYLILKAMAMGRVNNDKTTLLPILEQAVLEFPETIIAEKAKELIGFIEKGIPLFEDFSVIGKSELYEYSDKDKLFVLVFLDEKDDSRVAQTKISDFNKEFFSRDRLKTGAQLIDPSKSMIVVREFDNANKAREYIKSFERTKKHVIDYKSRKILFIANENYKVFMSNKDIEVYEKFFLTNY